MPDTQDDGTDDLVIERPLAVSDLMLRSLLMKSLREASWAAEGNDARKRPMRNHRAKIRQLPPV